MSDEEEDYMSDKFLDSSQDVRPSLVHNRAKKRQFEVEKKQEEEIKKQKEMKKLSSATVDNETLQTALSKPLSEENKGFKLLVKMGYKPGQALGKSSDNEDNEPSTSGTSRQRLKEPLAIAVTTNRHGLGRDAALKELAERKQYMREQRLRRLEGDEASIDEFRRRTYNKFGEKQIRRALKKCKIICENLDRDSNIDKPEMPFFWLKTSAATESDDGDEDTKAENKDRQVNEEEEDGFSNSEKLELLTNYIRTSYFYCIWCGTRYKDEDDLNDNCPGLTKEEH